jgi:hypothetical protein
LTKGGESQKMKNKIYQGWDKWVEKFKPIKNHFRGDPEQSVDKTNPLT